MQSFSFIFKVVPLFTILLLFSNSIILSQDLNDTITVDEVVIGATKIKKFQAGVKAEKIDAKQFELMQDGNLSDLLSRYTPLSFKSMAGGLSTIRFRGTSADHTSINFGGINLNSLTLGHSNMSNIPMYLFDEVGLQYGSASAVNGTGSIGGAIYLGLKNQWVDGFKGELRVAHGSFGEQLYGTKLFVGNGKWESVTRAYYYYKKNNFKYFDPIDKDHTTGVIGKYKRQRNASIQNKGVLQELNYRFNTHEHFKIKLWAENSWHLIQPVMSEQDTGHLKKNTYEDEHIRIWSDYENKKNKIKYQLGFGYVFDKGIHNESNNPIQTQRIISNASIEHNLFINTSYKIGLKAFRIFPDVYSYSEDINYEDRIDFFLSLSQKLLKERLKVTLNLRQGYVTNFKSPFIPAASFSFQAIKNQNHILKIIGNIARSYRIPTFNDRHWEPGGNPDLLPEDGENFEAGINYTYKNESLIGTLKINTFFMDIDNWTLWVPGSTDWEAQNVLRVQSKGLEFVGDLKYKFGQLNFSNGLNYTLTNTIRIKDIDNIAIGRQMEYIPMHTVLLFGTISNNKISFSIDGKFTDERYTDKNKNSFTNLLHPYFLLNTNFKYKFIFSSRQSLSLSLIVNNILNEDYQSQLNYAMPGINYRISITYNYN